MKRLGIAVVLILVTSRGGGAQSVCPGDAADLERFSDRFFHRYLVESPGASLAVAVVHDGRLTLAKGYGVADEASRRPVTPRTVFHVASLSKVVTTVAVLRGVQEGRLDLDTDLNRFLSGFTVPSDPARPVTLAHLLTHTSGLEGPLFGGIVDRPADLIPLGEWFAAHPLRRAAPPGGEVRYSNEGMSLAGHVLETATGRSFEAAVEEAALRPIGMRSSTFRQPPPAAIASRVATAGAGRVPDALVLRPAGALVSTAEDMSRLMIEILEGGAALGPETAAQLRTLQWTGHPAVPGIAYGLFEARMAGRRVLWHTGARVHFSILALVPEERLGVFLVHSMRQGGPFQGLRAEYVRALIGRCGDVEAPPTHRPPGGPVVRPGVYRPSILPSTGPGRLAWLALDTPVQARSDGSIVVDLPGGEPPFVLQPIGVGAFADGRGAFAGFPDGGERMFLSVFPQDPLTLQRLAWYERGRVHAVLMASAALVVAGYATVAGVRAGLRRLRGRSRPRDSRGPRAARLAAVGAGALLALAPVVVMVLVVGTPVDEGANGLRRVLAIGLGIATLAAGLSAALPVFAVQAWRRGWWGGVGRIAYTAVAAAAALLVLLLVYYRALVFWL